MMNKPLTACLWALFFVSVVTAASAQTGESLQDLLTQLRGHLDDSRGNVGQGENNRASAPSASPAVRLSLVDAIRYSIEGNQDIQVVSYTPQQAREEVVNAESVYDPSVFAESSYRRQPNLQSSVENIVMEDTGVVQTGLRKPLPTGGSLSTYLETRYENLIDAEFSRTYRNIFAPTIEIRQPLLKNLGSQKEKTAKMNNLARITSVIKSRFFLKNTVQPSSLWEKFFDRFLKLTPHAYGIVFPPDPVLPHAG